MKSEIGSTASLGGKRALSSALMLALAVALVGCGDDGSSRTRKRDAAANGDSGRGGSGGTGGAKLDASSGGGSGGTGGTAGTGGSGGSGGTGGAKLDAGGVDAAGMDGGTPDGSTVTPDTAAPPDGAPLFPATAVPSPWVFGDIGDVGATGQSGTDNKTYQLRASGTDVFGAADSFGYLYQPISGDAEIVARLVSAEAPNADTKTGVMFRESLTAESKNAFMLVFPRLNKGSRLQYRNNTTDTGHYDLPDTDVTALPVWLRLVREGNVFTGYSSIDGVTWREEGKATIAMGANIYVGLAHTSHVKGMLANAVFDSVRITRVPGTWAHVELNTLGGSAVGSLQKLDVNGSGAGIKGMADSFTFVHQKQQADAQVELVVKVSSLGDTAGAASAGIMIRPSLMPGARMVFFGVQDGPVPRFRMVRRTGDNGNVSTVNAMAGAVPDAGAPADAATGVDAGVVSFTPVWLKLVRDEMRFAAFYSFTGAPGTWVFYADAPNTNIASNAYVGVAVTADTAAAITPAVLEDIAVDNTPDPLPARDGGAVDAATSSDAGSVDAITGG